MSSTSQKHKLFVSSPMGIQNVNNVPGIGPVSAKSFGLNGISQASQLYVMYVEAERKQQEYVDSLQQYTGVKPCFLNKTFYALNEWDIQHDR